MEKSTGLFHAAFSRNPWSLFKPPVLRPLFATADKFSARVHFAHATPGCSCAHIAFRDNNPVFPYIYIMGGDDLKEFFHGITTGLIRVHSDGFDVRLTWVKRGTQLFVRPVL